MINIKSKDRSSTCTIISIITLTAISSFYYYFHISKINTNKIKNEENNNNDNNSKGISGTNSNTNSIRENDNDDDDNNDEVLVVDKRSLLQNLDNSLFFPRQSYENLASIPSHFMNSIPDDNDKSISLSSREGKKNVTSDIENTNNNNKPRTLKRQLSPLLPNSISMNNTMPKRIILIRHGQSMGNVKEHLYSKIPDHSMPITKKGWEQAKQAGNNLRHKIINSSNVDESVHFILSPYIRTMETFHGIASAWCDSTEITNDNNNTLKCDDYYERLKQCNITMQEDPRIREQDFGNYQCPEVMIKCKKERMKFGHFYYRFPNGESAADVYDRVSTFLDSLWRSFHYRQADNYVLVTHGISIRVFLTRYFRYTMDEFDMLANPHNCETIVLENDGSGKFQLQGRYDLVDSYEESVLAGNVNTDNKSSGHIEFDKSFNAMHKNTIFNRKLRTIPKQVRKVRKTRLNYSSDDDEE